MVLIKEIELALKPESNEVRAPEDEILADSVLELANTDFTQVDDHENTTAGSIRKHVEADMRVAYPGKPTTRKKVFKESLEVDRFEKQISDSDKESDIENLEESGLDSDNDHSIESHASDSDADGENDLDSDYNGSILGDEIKSDGSQSASEEATDEGDLLNSSKGIDLFTSRARDIEGDIAKGRSIRNQLTIWEKLIECRIKLQPNLINANKLYQKDSFQDFKSSLGSEESEVLLKTYSSLSNLMKGLLELQDNLINAVPTYKEMKSQKRKGNNDSNGSEVKNKKVCVDLLGEIDDDFKPFQNSSIQKWNEKTRVSSGKINKNDFSAFDLPTLKQIEEILLDRDRLLRRTHTKRSNYSVLGKEEKNATEEVDTNENSKKKNQGEYDPEIFDDDDFYHKLLRDFIERKTADVTDVSKRGKKWLELQKLRSRMKAKVDTRASKGRKIRFTVHNKMVNFMAPVPSHTWTDEARNELFKSLFC